MWQMVFKLPDREEIGRTPLLSLHSFETPIRSERTITNMIKHRGYCRVVFHYAPVAITAKDVYLGNIEGIYEWLGIAERKGT